DLVGYLDRLGAELDRPLLELDRAALDRALRRIDEKVRAATAGLSTSDWSDPKVDYRRMRQRLGPPAPLLAEVRAVLPRYARPVPTDPDGHVGDLLDHGTAEVAAGYLDLLARIRREFDALCAGPAPVTPQSLDDLAR